MRTTEIILLLVCLLVLCNVTVAETAATQATATTSTNGKCFVYVSTFTGPKSKGIYLYQMDLNSGALTSLGLAAETKNPGFVDIDPQHKFLYAANEVSTFEGKPGGAISAFSIDQASGKLTLLNSKSSVGTGPCHVLVDATGKTVFAANYGSGSVIGIPIQPDGQLGQMTAFIQHGGKSVDADRQSSPHAHCVTLDPANHFAFACDLGIDKVMIYKFRPAHGALERNQSASVSLKPGSGPRHMVFHPNGREAYVINELNSTITRFGYDADHGVLTEEQTISTVPVDFKGTNYPAEVTVHPFGKFLYGSNRGHDSIAIFAIDANSGALKPVAYEPTRGKFPRHFAIDPTGTFLLAANQDSNNLVVFRIDPVTGMLKATGQTVEIGSPACVRFLCNP